MNRAVLATRIDGLELAWCPASTGTMKRHRLRWASIATSIHFQLERVVESSLLRQFGARWLIRSTRPKRTDTPLRTRLPRAHAEGWCRRRTAAVDRTPIEVARDRLAAGRPQDGCGSRPPPACSALGMRAGNHPGVIRVPCHVAHCPLDLQASDPADLQARVISGAVLVPPPSFRSRRRARMSIRRRPARRARPAPSR